MFLNLKRMLWTVVMTISLSYSIEAKTVNRIVAWVNDEVITEEDLKRAIPETETGSQTEVLERLIEDRLILQAANEKGIKVDQIELEEIIAKLKSRFTSQEELEDALSLEGLTMSDLTKRYTESLLKREIVSLEIEPVVSISEKEVQAIRDAFSYQVKVKYILLKSQEEAILTMSMLDRGENFDDLIKKYSGHELDYFSPHQMVKEFSSACFNLTSQGEISGIVKTDLGFHIIMLLDKKRLNDEELEALVKEQKNKLREEKFNQEFSRWVDSLKKKAYIKLNKEGRE